MMGRIGWRCIIHCVHSVVQFDGLETFDLRATPSRTLFPQDMRRQWRFYGSNPNPRQLCNRQHWLHTAKCQQNFHNIYIYTSYVYKEFNTARRYIAWHRSRCSIDCFTFRSISGLRLGYSVRLHQCACTAGGATHGAIAPETTAIRINNWKERVHVSYVPISHRLSHRILVCNWRTFHRWSPSNICLHIWGRWGNSPTLPTPSVKKNVSFEEYRRPKSITKSISPFPKEEKKIALQIWKSAMLRWTRWFFLRQSRKRSALHTFCIG